MGQSDAIHHDAVEGWLVTLGDHTLAQYTTRCRGNRGSFSRKFRHRGKNFF